MREYKKWGSGGAVAGAALGALIAGSVPASAAENITGDVGIYFTSHFVSYGLDVWGGGTDIFGSRSTTSIYGDVGLKLTDSLTFGLNVWTDINNNTASAIGGHLQEVDVNPSLTFTTGKFAFAVAYGAWSYAGDVEEVIDTSIAFDDTDLLAPGFALKPKFTWHYRASGNGAQKEGSAIVLSIGPGFDLGEGFSLAIPAGVAFFTTKDFQGGTASGYGYSYFGGSLGYAIGGIPAAYGAWSVNFDLIAYFTDSTAIPGNPDSDFVTGTFGLKVGF